MTGIRNKPGGRPAKSRIDKQNRVVSTKLTELQFYAIRKRATEAGLRVSEYVRQAVVSAEVTPRLNRQDADRKSTRLNSSHKTESRMPSSA